MKKPSGIVIDYETADMIAVDVMKDHLSYLKEEVGLHVEEGQWMHPEDFDKSMTVLIPALEALIDYFGG